MGVVSVEINISLEAEMSVGRLGGRVVGHFYEMKVL